GVSQSHFPDLGTWWAPRLRANVKTVSRRRRAEGCPSSAAATRGGSGKEKDFERSRWSSLATGDIRRRGRSRRGRAGCEPPRATRTTGAKRPHSATQYAFLRSAPS